MSRLGAEPTDALLAHRIGLRAAALIAEEHVPWASRDPATQACAIIFGAMLLQRVRNQSSSSSSKAAEVEVPTFTRLSEVGGMAPSTIRDGFKQMMPWLVVVSEHAPSFSLPLSFCPLSAHSSRVVEKSSVGVGMVCAAAGVPCAGA
jgi:hypothetical protein